MGSDYKLMNNVRGLISQAMKTHSTYDVRDRMTHYYEAPVDASDGEPCLLTRYQYIGDSVNMYGSIEELSSWDDTWDF